MGPYLVTAEIAYAMATMEVINVVLVNSVAHEVQSYGMV